MLSGVNFKQEINMKQPRGKSVMLKKWAEANGVNCTDIKIKFEDSNSITQAQFDEFDKVLKLIIKPLTKLEKALK